MIDLAEGIPTPVATERCDRCGAKAKTIATKGIMELYFCGHHATEHIEALEDDDWEISTSA